MFVLQHTSICPNFIFIVLRIQLPLCSNDHDDVTDLEICGFHKNTNSRYLKKKTLFLLQIKKNHLSYIEDYFMAKNSVAVEVTFKHFFPAGTRNLQH